MHFGRYHVYKVNVKLQKGKSVTFSRDVTVPKAEMLTLLEELEDYNAGKDGSDDPDVKDN